MKKPMISHSQRKRRAARILRIYKGNGSLRKTGEKVNLSRTTVGKELKRFYPDLEWVTVLKGGDQ